ncbi:chitinase-3-like protein 1 [Oppia nitens]|uniref:chitinase-3-like protein 1 n=1 Tax=Oppia nitens TaxID=1686743 RepID=UPI0023D9D70D|nr:chitinase-3-like protein 1 [Oppia nitens]
MLSLNLLVVLLPLLGQLANSASLSVPKRDHNDYVKNPKRVTCYVGTWFHYRGYSLDQIPAQLCTHLYYGFAKINEKSYELEAADPELDIHLNGYKTFNDLRQKNPLLSTFISLGGFYEGSEKYSDMAKQPNRQTFIKSAVDFLKKYDFDGLDLNWEYPANRGGDEQKDKDNFVQLVQELRAELDKDGYLLTAHLSPVRSTIDKAYDIEKLNTLLDWANVQAYDYHGSYDNGLEHPAPLYNNPYDPKTDSVLSINYTVSYYLDRGLSKDKMVLGLPFHGRSWILEDKSHVRLHDSARGMSPELPYSKESGVVAFNEICKLSLDYPSQWHMHFDWDYEAPYTYNDKIFVGYDDIYSIECKITYLKKIGLSGVMISGLQFDDYKNDCRYGQYSLTYKVQELLNGLGSMTHECAYRPPPPPDPTTLPPPTTPTTHHTDPTLPPTLPPTTTPIPISERCARQCGKRLWCNISFPGNEHKFIACRDIPDKGWWETYFDCSVHTKFNPRTENCDIPDL